MFAAAFLTACFAEITSCGETAGLWMDGQDSIFHLSQFLSLASTVSTIRRKKAPSSATLKYSEIWRFMSRAHFVSSSLMACSEYITDLFITVLFCGVMEASFSLALGLKERRKSRTMRAWTRMCRRKDRSLICKCVRNTFQGGQTGHLTSNSNKSLLVRYLGLNADARSSLLALIFRFFTWGSELHFWG